MLARCSCRRRGSGGARGSSGWQQRLRSPGIGSACFPLRCLQPTSGPPAPFRRLLAPASRAPALSAFAAGGACFAVNRTLLRGWGHSVFHLFLCLYAHHTLLSAHALAVVLHRAAVAQALLNTGGAAGAGAG